jgi:glutaredoxin
LNVQVLGISIDHIPCLQAWAKSIGEISFPLLSDFWPHGEVAKLYGAFRFDEGRSERAIFIIDKEGVIRYIDIHDIDDQPSNDVLFAELEKIAPEEFESYNKHKNQEEELPKGGVVLYCTHWCPSCRRARYWLENHNIEFVEVNIDRNAAADRQVREWANGNRTTPTFDVNGTVVVSFDESRLADLLLKK